MKQETQDRMIIHGHRGCRGLLPENTIPAFSYATELGVDALELDVVLTADSVVLVSHDPFMHHEICANADGSHISEKEEGALNIYKMTAQEAQQFKCGSFPHPRFPSQKQVIRSKPTLKELVHFIREFCADNQLKEPLWNIEVKSQPDWDNNYQPVPKAYAEIFLATFNELGLAGNAIIQSFDPRILEAIHELEPALKLVLLSDEAEMTIEQKLATLSFKPYGYSPNYLLVKPSDVSYCAEHNLELLVWTVNETSEMRRMADMGIRNIITDYPDSAIKIFR